MSEAEFEPQHFKQNKTPQKTNSQEFLGRLIEERMCSTTALLGTWPMCKVQVSLVR
jgi:hypothetical protein